MSPKTTKLLKFILMMLVGAAFGFGLMVGVMTILPDEIKYLKGDGIGGGVAVVLLLVISYFTVVSLHELGHLLTGLAQGFRFYMYVVGFLGIGRDENERIKVYFNKDMQLFGGIAGSFPTKEEPDVLRKMAWVVAAGPLTTLFTGILFTWGAFSMLYNITPDATVLYKLVNGFLLMCALFSVAIFGATTIPSRTGPFFTDRARFFRLIRGGKAAQVEQALFELITLSYAGKRYQDLNKAKIELIKTDASPVMQSISDYYMYYYHLDRQEYELTLPYVKKLEQASSEMPAALKNEYLREATFCYAFIAKEAENAQNCWQAVQKFYEKQESVPVLRTKIALHIVQNQEEQAVVLLQKALEKLGDNPRKGTDLLEKDLLEQLQAALNQHTTQV